MATDEFLATHHELDEAAIAREAEADRLRAFNERSITGAYSAFVGIAFMTWVVSNSVGGWLAGLVWGSGMLAVEGAILWVGWFGRRAQAESPDAAWAWGRRQLALTGLAGAGWGSAVWFVWPSADPLHYVFTLTIVVGVAGISMVTMAAYARASTLFFAGINGLPLLHLLWHQPPMAHLIAVGLVVGLVIQLGYCREIRGVMRDEALQKARNAALLRLLNQWVIRDPLTGAGSRRCLFEQLGLAVSASDRHGSDASLIMFDIDHFKRINDTHGHPAGDRVLCQVVRIVQGRLRAGDCLGRVGGEEFMVLMPHTRLADAQMLAEDLRCRVADAAWQEGDEPLQVSASFGVAQLQRGEGEAAWFRRVDQALYRAKAQGRNRVESA